MNKEEFMKAITTRYASSFDIYKNYRYHGVKYPAYGYFYNRNMKYILTKDAKLWEANCYEHLFFIYKSEIKGDIKEYILNLVEQDIEPHFIRNDNKYPAPSHMYSFVTIIVVNDDDSFTDYEKTIRSIKWKKDYMLTIRGNCELRVAVVEPENRKIVVNKAGKELMKFINNII